MLVWLFAWWSLGQAVKYTDQAGVVDVDPLTQQLAADNSAGARDETTEAVGEPGHRWEDSPARVMEDRAIPRGIQVPVSAPAAKSVGFREDDPDFEEPRQADVHRSGESLIEPTTQADVHRSGESLIEPTTQARFAPDTDKHLELEEPASVTTPAAPEGQSVVTTPAVVTPPAGPEGQAVVAPPAAPEPTGSLPAQLAPKRGEPIEPPSAPIQNPHIPLAKTPEVQLDNANFDGGSIGMRDHGRGANRGMRDISTEEHKSVAASPSVDPAAKVPAVSTVALEEHKSVAASPSVDPAAKVPPPADIAAAPSALPQAQTEGLSTWRYGMGWWHEVATMEAHGAALWERLKSSFGELSVKVHNEVKPLVPSSFQEMFKLSAALAEDTDDGLSFFIIIALAVVLVLILSFKRPGQFHRLRDNISHGVKVVYHTIMACFSAAHKEWLAEDSARDVYGETAGHAGYYDGKSGFGTQTAEQKVLITIRTVRLNHSARDDHGYYCHILNCPRGIGGPQPSEALLQYHKNAQQKTGIGYVAKDWSEAMTVSFPPQFPELQIALYRVDGPANLNARNSRRQSSYIGAALMTTEDIDSELNATVRAQHIGSVKKRLNILSPAGALVAKVSVSFYRPDYTSLSENGFGTTLLAGYRMETLRALDDAKDRLPSRPRSKGNGYDRADDLQRMKAVLFQVLTGNCVRATEDGKDQLVWFEADSHYWAWHEKAFDDPSSQVGPNDVASSNKVVAGFVPFSAITSAEVEDGVVVLKYQLPSEEPKELLFEPNPLDPLRSSWVMCEIFRMIVEVVRPHSPGGSVIPDGDSSDYEVNLGSNLKKTGGSEPLLQNRSSDDLPRLTLENLSR